MQIYDNDKEGHYLPKKESDIFLDKIWSTK